MRKHIIAVVVILMLLLSTQAVFATANPNVTIVNPVSESIVYSDNLLVSVKMTEPLTIRVSVTQEFKTVNGVNTTVSLEDYKKTESSQISSVAVGTTESFTSTNNLSFYTKRVENVKPGIYKIKVETIDAEDNVTHTNSNMVEIKAKEDNPANSATVESQNSGTAQFLKNILKAIFN
jgi:predicted phage tail protein